jgi:hypothetical protein
MNMLSGFSRQTDGMHNIMIVTIVSLILALSGISCGGGFFEDNQEAGNASETIFSADSADSE